jgi:hypothetical protein
MRIRLETRKTLDLRAYAYGRRLSIYRVLGQIQFRQRVGGWSQNHLAIVDTGAPYSVIPSFLWEKLRWKAFFKTSLQGIVPGKRAKSDAVLARVACRLLDSQKISIPRTIWALLAQTDRVPLILGWSGLLEYGKLFVDSRSRRAWIQF